MIQNLLDEVILALDKIGPKNSEPESNLNLFKIERMETDKTKICKVLYELLLPKSKCQQSYTCLALFFEEVLHLEISREELESVEVYREFLIDEGERIDLLIKTPTRQIPIQMKINSKDEGLKSTDHPKAAINSKLYYLTLQGEGPGEHIADNKELSNIISISFKQEILNWLGLCLIQEDTQKNVLTREVIKQFMVSVCQITDQNREKQSLDVLEILMDSPENFRSAVEISKYVDMVKQKILRDVFTSIESKVNHRKLENEYDYQCNEDTITGYYSHKQFESPGISYKYKENVKPGVDVWVRVEVEAKRGYANRIYAGYFCTKQGRKEEGLLSNIEIEDILKVPPWTDRWWAYYEYLPADDVNQCPNFKLLNEPFYQLLDDEYFEEFTTKCAEKVMELLNR